MNEIEELQKKIAILEAQAKIDKLELEAARTQADLAQVQANQHNDKFLDVLGDKFLDESDSEAVESQESQESQLTKEQKLEQTFEFLKLGLERVMPQVIRGATTNFSQASPFIKYILGAGLDSGYLSWNYTSEKSKFTHPQPSPNYCPILEVVNRYNYMTKENPQTLTYRYLGLQPSGKPIKLGKCDNQVFSKKENLPDYEEFANQTDFDHPVFWAVSANHHRFNLPAVTIAFVGKYGYVPDPKKIQIPKFTPPDYKVSISADLREDQSNLEELRSLKALLKSSSI